VIEELEKAIRRAQDTGDREAWQEVWRLRRRYNIYDVYCEEEEVNALDPVLCYVDLPWCYFTTRVLSKQWGDDWNDAPYEHNAGRPYRPREQGWRNREGLYETNMRKDGSPGWRVVKVGLEGPLETPADVARSNSSYSVEQINAGEAPWLRWPDYGKYESLRPIYAGTPFSEFRRIVLDAGCELYMNVQHTTSTKGTL